MSLLATTAPASILDLIGNTPMLPLDFPCEGATARILAKLEFLNPSGSVKDRIADFIVKRAEARGEIRKGSILIEATSGNTGISLAMVGAVRGYRVVVVMPDIVSRERIRILEHLGAEVCLTPREQGYAGALAKVEELATTDSRFYRPSQFENLDNIDAHATTTGPEIQKQAGGKVDAFVAGIGTGGTLFGVRMALLPENPDLLTVAVEPDESAVLSGEMHIGEHDIAGIGDGFIPPLVDLALVDKVERVKSSEAIEAAKMLARRYGLMVGISSGANLIAAARTVRSLPPGANVVTVLPDRTERYFSTALYPKEWDQKQIRLCDRDCECVFTPRIETLI